MQRRFVRDMVTCVSRRDREWRIDMVGAAAAVLSVVVCTFLSGWIAGQRGRSPRLWYWMGALFGPVAPVVVVLLPPVPTAPVGQTR
jgi:hypothetical protein